MYQSDKAEYCIFHENGYNTGKNSCRVGIAGSSKAIFSKYQKLIFFNQAKYWKWVSFMEKIGIID